MDSSSLPPPPDRRDGEDGAVSHGGERTSGLILEHCYRHQDVATGVHCTRCGRPICTDCMRPAAVGYQCPECVREAIRTGPRRRWRVRFFLGRPGSITTALLALNIGMFVVEVVTGASRSVVLGGNNEKLFRLGAMATDAVAFQHQYWRLFTAMFLHAGLLHLALNMYALYLFGYLIESAFGRLRFLAIYFLCGFLASVTSFAFGNPHEVAVGASGAIFGLLGAWVAFNYRRRQTGFNRANLQWATMLIVLNLVIGFSIGGIDNLAHIGGLVAGVVAGWVAEGFGPRSTRLAVGVAGFVVMALIGVALTAWRVAALS